MRDSAIDWRRLTGCKLLSRKCCVGCRVQGLGAQGLASLLQLKKLPKH